MQFNTCGWTGESVSSGASPDAGGTGGTSMRNETLEATQAPSMPTTTGVTLAPMPTTAEYVNTNTTEPTGSGVNCAAWAAMESAPSGTDIAAAFDFNLRFSCEITARNKNKCTAKCINGGKIIGKNKFVMSCKCPRFVSFRL